MTCANRTENTEEHSDLFQPVSLGPYRLANRTRKNA